MHTDAHPYGHAFGPGMPGQGPLDSHGCRDGIGGTRKGDEKGIPLGVDLVAVPLPERRAQQPPTLRQYADVALAQLLQEARRALHVSEEQRDGSCWQIIPGTSWLGLRLAAAGLLWLWWQQAQFAGRLAEELAESLHIIGAGPGSAPLPARDHGVQGSTDAIGHHFLGPSAFLTRPAQQGIGGGLRSFLDHVSSDA